MRIAPMGWILLFCITFWTLVGFIGCQIVSAEEYTLDQWADAIHLAENNDNYGIISIPCIKGEQCRQYCKNTVYNTLIKYRSTRCKPEWGDLTCLANRYCPIGSDTDDGTCKYWKKNVKFFLEKSDYFNEKEMKLIGKIIYKKWFLENP